MKARVIPEVWAVIINSSLPLIGSNFNYDCEIYPILKQYSRTAYTRLRKQPSVHTCQLCLVNNRRQWLKSVIDVFD